MSKRRVVVTGLGILSPLGNDLQSNWAAIKAGREIPDADLPEAPKDRAGPPASPALVALLKVLLAAKSEEHHVDELEKQFEMIERMGLQNYIQLNSEPVGS